MGMSRWEEKGKDGLAENRSGMKKRVKVAGDCLSRLFLVSSMADLAYHQTIIAKQLLTSFLAFTNAQHF